MNPGKKPSTPTLRSWESERLTREFPQIKARLHTSKRLNTVSKIFRFPVIDIPSPVELRNPCIRIMKHYTTFLGGGYKKYLKKENSENSPGSSISGEPLYRWALSRYNSTHLIF
jgi:hypothetical protein